MNGLSNFYLFKMRMSLGLAAVASAILLVAVTLIISACEKNNLVESETGAVPSDVALTISSEGTEYYFIDNQSVPQSQFTWEVDTLWYHIVSVKEKIQVLSTSTTMLTAANHFTTKK